MIQFDSYFSNGLKLPTRIVRALFLLVIWFGYKYCLVRTVVTTYNFTCLIEVVQLVVGIIKPEPKTPCVEEENYRLKRAGER